MNDRIAVCLTTCGRYDYTERTLASFEAHNPDRSRFIFLHGDDASDDKWVPKLARRHGFRTVVRHKERRGWLALRTTLIQQAAAEADWVLVLENDIESIRPFPWAWFDYVSQFGWIYALRLFGEFKGPDRTDPCKAFNGWAGNTPVAWVPMRGAPEPTETTRIHWSAQPTVTRSAPLLALHRDGIKETRLHTARVVNNVMVHIGVHRTPKVSIAC